MIRSQQTDDARPDPEDLLDAEPADPPAGRQTAVPGRFRRRVLRSTALVPVLFTLGNGLCGFAAVHFAARPPAPAVPMRYLVFSALFIGAAMICDMLDGQLARLTRRTSDFGAQLDSMCDAISFGVAPAVLMVRTAAPALHELNVYVSVERVIWGVAAAYVLCAVLRLARFNVEHESARLADGYFTGLPSPAAAATVAALVLFFDHLAREAWIPVPLPRIGMGLLLPVITLLVALLMVSRIRYPHLINQYVRGKRPFGYIVRLVLIGLAALFQPYLTAVVLTLGFVLAGALRAAWGMLQRKPKIH